jgi:hypothetical protein
MAVAWLRMHLGRMHINKKAKEKKKREKKERKEKEIREPFEIYCSFEEFAAKYLLKLISLRRNIEC